MKKILRKSPDKIAQWRVCPTRRRVCANEDIIGRASIGNEACGRLTRLRRNLKTLLQKRCMRV